MAEPNSLPERLLRQYVAGDAAAFEELVGLYEERLFAFSARMVGDTHLAEDVFQTVWIKVAKHAASFDGRASFSTWLFRIARNTALDELRRRRHAPVTLDPDAGGLDSLAGPDHPGPLEKMERDELAARVREVLADLPPAQREAFLLKEEGELDFGEIGRVLGCGRETAKSRFRLAVGKLREALGLDGGRS